MARQVRRLRTVVFPAVLLNGTADGGSRLGAELTINIHGGPIELWYAGEHGDNIQALPDQQPSVW